MLASILSTFWNDQVVDAGREGIFLVLAGFLGSFLFIRASTRLMRSPKVPWWPGSVSTGDLHVHHLVFGIVLMLIGPTIAYAIPDQSPWWELTAVAFGIGAGLTFDEFALWLHLDDVYWSEEGRRSVDAVAIAAVFMGLVFLGAVPFELDSSDADLFVTSLIALLIVVVTAGIGLLKGKLWHGTLGLFFYPLSLYGAIRLAKPGSPWAKRLYAKRKPEKQRRAEERYRDRRTDRVLDTLRTAVGGRPTESIEAHRRESGG
jgi:lysyl-tRNA synthetase class 2